MTERIWGWKYVETNRELDDKKIDGRNRRERWDSGYENGSMWN